MEKSKRPPTVLEIRHQAKWLRPEQSMLLLHEWVNLSQDPGAMDHFKLTIARGLDAGFEKLLPEVKSYEEVSKESDAPADVAMAQASYKDLFDLIRNCLRHIWEDPNARRKETLILGLRDYVNGLSKPLPQRIYRLTPFAYWGEPSPEEPTPLVQALIYLFKSVSKLRCCPNAECPARYFFGLRRNQRYCSLKCAQGAEREQKRDWWHAHGSRWRSRKARKKKKGSSKTVAIDTN